MNTVTKKNKEMAFDTLMPRIVARCNGVVEDLPYSNPNVMSQEFLEKTYEHSDSYVDQVILDLGNQKIKQSAYIVNDKMKKKKYRYRDGKIYFTCGGKSYSVPSLPDIPVTIKSCKYKAAGEERIMLISKISIGDEVTHYFHPDYFFSMFYLSVSSDPDVDMAYLMTYNSIDDSFCSNEVIGFPNVESVSELIEFVNRLSSTICFIHKEGKGNDIV